MTNVSLFCLLQSKASTWRGCKTARFAVLPGRKPSPRRVGQSTWLHRSPQILYFDVLDVTAHPTDHRSTGPAEASQQSAVLHLTSPHTGTCGRRYTFTTLQLPRYWDYYHLRPKSVQTVAGKCWHRDRKVSAPSLNRNSYFWSGMFGFLSNRVKSMQEKKASSDSQ